VISRLIALLLLLACAVCGAANTATANGDPEALLAAGELRAEVLVETPAPLYQRAPFILAVEIGTPRWFSRGTRVADFRIPGAVVLPVSSFADNRSARIDGRTWSLQRWRFRVYPRKQGPLALPPLRVFVSVNQESGEAAEGDLTLRAPRVTIVTPPGVPADRDWVAARALDVDEAWEGEHEDLRVGDALVRRRRLRIADAPAMTLPQQTLPKIEGLSLYQAPPDVQDSNTRGSLNGTREEHLVITIEAAGDYEIPGASWYWFDTGSGEMHELTLPPRRFSASAAANVTVVTGAGDRIILRAGPWLAIAGLAFVALLLGLRFRRALGASSGRLQRRIAARRAWARALREADAARALDLLRARAAGSGEASALRAVLAGQTVPLDTLEALLAAAYGGAPLPAREALWRLWHGLGGRGRRRASRAPALYLNPPASGR
jgi:hypothetical protein